MVSSTETLMRGARCQLAGQLDEAERIYRQVLEQEPRNAEALHLLGTLALQTGQLEAAVEHLTQAIDCDGSQAVFHVNLGEAYRRSGDLERAIACNRRALELQPNLLGARANLGMLEQSRGNWPAAADCFRAMVGVNPNDPYARSLLGRALLKCDQLDEAETHFRRAVELAPHDGRAHYNLATVLNALGRLGDAAASYRAALARTPEEAELHNNLAAVLQRLGQASEAESHYRHALALDPTSPTLHNNLGALLIERQRYDEALPLLQRAKDLSEQIEPEPDESNSEISSIHGNLGICALMQGQLDLAIESYRAAVRLDPADAEQHSSLVYALNFHPDYDAAAVFAEHRQWARMHADPLAEQIRPHTNDRSPERRLRLGYVSAHFGDHALNFFVEPLLNAHDRAAFEVYGYYNDASGDQTTERLRRGVDHWRDIALLGDEQAAQVVRRDKIDILIDLAGHIGGSRLQLFARKPAPIQVTYLGYQNTTGMSAIDYRLTDAWSDPPGTTEEFYTEKLVRLPCSFFCYQPSADAPPVTPLPAVANGYVTFGSFNNFAKVTPQVLAAWARLLAVTGDSRLLILAPLSKALGDDLRRAFQQQGVAAERLDLRDRLPRAEYLKLISQVDIALDPFPFNGHTTTCDALWQGVPVVTLAGRMYAERFGSSAHVNLDLQELIAGTPDEYQATAARLAGDLERLKELRATLRERMKSSPLLDHAGLARHLEAAYRTMWRDWCSAQSG